MEQVKIRVSLWSRGCADGKEGGPPELKYRRDQGYMNGFKHGQSLFLAEQQRAKVLSQTIPAKEENALRAAFEETMHKTFRWDNFTRNSDGYLNNDIQAAWFACRCGWLTGRNYK